jgi:hypothetical protein
MGQLDSTCVQPHHSACESASVPGALLGHAFGSSKVRMREPRLCAASMKERERRSKSAGCAGHLPSAA